MTLGARGRLLVALAALVGCRAGPASGPTDAGAREADGTGGIAHADADADADGRNDDAGPVLPRALFNGRDFTGWDRYLGEPSPGAAPLGTDNDPLGVYSIVAIDGEPAIRISGQVWGALISREELCDFHLRLEYRWGTALWPPLNAFDSGVMYLSSGPLGAVNAGGPALSDPIGSGAFLVSMEYQIAGGDVGGMYNLGPISFQAGARARPAELLGAWNQVDIIVAGGVARHQLNGQDVTTGAGFTLAWPGQPAQPLACGKLQLQSEGAEIMFRRIELLP